MSGEGPIRVGVGGWTYAPWRAGNFFPVGLPAAQELAHASRRLTAIEVNGTFYRRQTPATFKAWHDATPPSFAFALKAPRYAVAKKDLTTAPQVAGFLASGLEELGPKLGPVLWQLPPTTPFAPDLLRAFLDLLPDRLNGLPLQHALEARHASFVDPAFPALAAARGVAVVLAESDEHSLIADPTAAFVYLRLRRCRAEIDTGYPAPELDAWAARIRRLAAGGTADGLPLLGPPPPVAPRPAWVFVISGAKERAPAAALALQERLGIMPAVEPQAADAATTAVRRGRRLPPTTPA